MLFVRLIALLPLFAIPASEARAASPPELAARPNLVIILTDDHGYGDVSTYHDSDVKTPTTKMDEDRAKNVAFIEHLDDRMGRVLDALRETGLERNTLVVFTADNGGSLRHGQSYHPWRDGKQSHYDGGLRVPFMARWPGRVQPGSSSDYAGLVFDLFPTFLELAGVELPTDLDAVSLVPILRGGTIGALRDLYFVRREGGPAYGGKSYEALVRGEWKLLQNDPYSPLELYNLENDPQETNDVAASNTELLNELAAALRAHIQRGGAAAWHRPGR
jgi:arylsulfatase A-like enzyme